MAKDLKAFLERMKEDSAFAEAVKEAGDRIKKAEENPGEGELIVKAAKELGYEFTMGDIERNFAEEQELDDEELERAAGGIIDISEFCMMAFYCYLWWNHKN